MVTPVTDLPRNGGARLLQGWVIAPAGAKPWIWRGFQDEMVPNAAPVLEF